MPRTSTRLPGEPRDLKVVLFSGGRGSGVLTRQLVSNPAVSLTIAINGYDDGASTGEVRRFLGDCLGPSDFRKNASRLASELGTCTGALVALLDTRLPQGSSDEDAWRAFDAIAGESRDAEGVASFVNGLDPKEGAAVARALDAFRRAVQVRPGVFQFSDCSIGNLMFAGLFLDCARDFNRTVDAYAGLVGLPVGLIENVTDGTNAWLVALDADGHLLASEQEIVDSTRPNRIRDIFLIDRPLTTGERQSLQTAGASAAALLRQREVRVGLNARLAEKVGGADLIIYAPGTQHSSLFPSYLTPGLSARIAGNLGAIKLLITNIQADAEISGSNAVDIIDRAVFYLKEKGTLPTPTPCLITHYIVNDPGSSEVEKPYVPLGPLDSIEDPRLVRIGNYEEGVSGRHDAERILAPFVEALLARDEPRRIAILLYDAGSTNKVVQTLLEMVRGGLRDLPLGIGVFYEGLEPLDAAFVASLGWSVRQIAPGTFADAARTGGFDYVLLFESSGMYRGEDLVGIASHVAMGRFDAVWGSRRLSVRDIEQSYRFRYRKNVVLGAISYVGSHLLSLAYLALYGRYISDTLSAARAIRTADAVESGIDLTHKRANQYLLSDLLRRKADILEIPVRFLPISPEKVKRTSPLEGIQSLLTILWRRIAPPRRRSFAAAEYAPDRRPSRVSESSR